MSLPGHFAMHVSNEIVEVQSQVEGGGGREGQERRGKRRRGCLMLHAFKKPCPSFMYALPTSMQGKKNFRWRDGGYAEM